MTKAMLYILYAIEYVSAKKHNTAFEQDTDDADLANSTGPDNCHLYSFCTAFKGIQQELHQG
jgi:hypothetical protein